MLLEGKTTLVTGAGRGLGQSVARAYARQGAQVVGVSNVQSELERTAEMIRAEGGDILTRWVDLADEGQIRRAMDEILERFGRVDVLVNNAARLPLKLFREMTMAEWDLTLAVNLRAPVLLCKLVLPGMIEQGRGSIINLSSGAAIKGFVRETEFCAAKFGLEGFSRALALELAPYNVAVNTITPGSREVRIRIKPTSMTQAEFDALSDEEQAQWDDSMVLTEAFVYLALQDAQHMTDQRVYAYDLAERVRREGWDFAYQS
jgi:NAD(P)-dependent dehydrogenase (short-subunit alcohol dehydrogenase family)